MAGQLFRLIPASSTRAPGCCAIWSDLDSLESSLSLRYRLLYRLIETFRLVDLALQDKYRRGIDKVKTGKSQSRGTKAQQLRPTTEPRTKIGLFRAKRFSPISMARKSRRSAPVKLSWDAGEQLGSVLCQAKTDEGLRVNTFFHS